MNIALFPSHVELFMTEVTDRSSDAARAVPTETAERRNHIKPPRWVNRRCAQCPPRHCFRRGNFSAGLCSCAFEPNTSGSAHRPPPMPPSLPLAARRAGQPKEQETLHDRSFPCLQTVSDGRVCNRSYINTFYCDVCSFTQVLLRDFCCSFLQNAILRSYLIKGTMNYIKTLAVFFYLLMCCILSVQLEKVQGCVADDIQARKSCVKSK